MADNVYTIGTGETYTTIAAWEAARQGNLVTETRREIGELKSEAFAESVTVDGSTTNASYYMWLRAKAGAEFNHVALTGARIVRTGLSVAVVLLTINDGYTRGGSSEGASSGAIGFCYQTDSGSVTSCGVRVAAGGENSLFENCLGYNLVSTSTMYWFRVTVDPVVARNCLVYNMTQGGASGVTNGFLSGTANYLTCYNCVAHNLSATYATSGSAYGFVLSAVYNCYGGGMAAFGAKLVYKADCTGDYNGADGTSSSIFAHNLQNKAAANQFISITPGSENYHLKAGADLIDAGNDAYGVEYDIDGLVVGARDDMGVDEIEEAAPSPSIVSADIPSLVSSDIASIVSAEIPSLISTEIASLISAELGSLLSGEIASAVSTDIASVTSAEIPSLVSAEIASLLSVEIGSLLSAEIPSLASSEIASPVEPSPSGLPASPSVVIYLSALHHRRLMGGG